MTVVNKFNVNKQQVRLDADIIENMSANDVSYNASTQYDENTVGNKLSKLESQAIYDVTANNDGVTFSSLSELLSDENLSTLIPVSVRCGGMSIRFVQSSDNKYIQYRLMSDAFSTTEGDWQGVDDVPTAGSNNLVKSGGVYCDLYGLQYTKEYQTEQGVFFDTKNDRIFVNNYNERDKIYIKLIYPTTTNLFGFDFYKGDTKQYRVSIVDGVQVHTNEEYCFTLETDIDSISISTPGDYVTGGKLTFNIFVKNSITEKINTLDGKINEIDAEVETLVDNTERLRISDMLYHWLKGEAFPLGFLGDSTTDGVQVTGWTGHKRADEDKGGAGAIGVVDYQFEGAYPTQLQNLLREEIGNNVKIYNIGYSGESLISLKPKLETLFSGVYSDTKMVAIVLGINDRKLNFTDAQYYESLIENLEYYCNFFIEKNITPLMVTNQTTLQGGNDSHTYYPIFQDYVQTLCNEAKKKISSKYNLEIIDMNTFDRLLLMCSSYQNIINDKLHFSEIGQKLESQFLFSKLIPWVYFSNYAQTIYFGFNCAKYKSQYNNGAHMSISNTKFKYEINYTRNETTNVCIFDAYIFVNSENGSYKVTFQTPQASGYIVVDGYTANPITINATNINIGIWDIGLHHVQVYTGDSAVVAFRGFLLEQ